MSRQAVDHHGPPAIAVRGLAKTFPEGTQALRGIDLDVRVGEGVVILGHNGSGKSTLLRCITGLERATSGHVAIEGLDIASASRADVRRARRSVGMVFQRFNLVGNLSAFQNVLFGALGRRSLLTLMRATAPASERALAMSCLERVGLGDKANQRADTLSGGQQQRVAIARMLMQQPRIVLADEPIASLDPKAGREVMELLWDVVRERGLTVVCTLHHLDMAIEYGDRIVGLKAGVKVIDADRDAISRDGLRGLYDIHPDHRPHASTTEPAVALA